MDIFVLDENLEAFSVIDTYSSLIWTDRYQECGDFEMCMAISTGIFDVIKQDRYLWSNASEHVMIIEKILVESDVEEGTKLTISGRSLESILDRRVVWGQRTLTGNLQNGIRALLEENVINPSKPERKISNFIFEESVDPAITSLSIDTQYTGDNLYDIITTICAERGIGFKVYLNNQKQFVFALYAGTDRSYEQIKNPYVVFSPDFDNLLNSNYMESKSALKNVTLVGGEGEGTERRYTAVGDTAGLERREIFTDARDVSSDINDDITSLFDFTEFPYQVFNNSSKTFVTDSRFNSSTADVSAYVGRRVSMSIPKYSNSSGAAPGYSTVFLDAAKGYVSTIKVWEANGESAQNSGSLETFEFLVPKGAKYVYSSMFSQNAIDSDIYYGEVTDFSAATIKLSNDEYIAQLRQRGKETLAENIDVLSFEGEAEPTTMFVYGRDYVIGDVVQIADGYGHSTKSRIIELITSVDESGTSTYPTFSTLDNSLRILPVDYEQVEYIESTGAQWIDLGYIPNDKTRIRVKFQLTSGDNTIQYIFGIKGAFSFRWYGTNAVYQSIGAEASSFSNAISAVDPHTVEKTPTKCTIDGQYSVTNTIGNVLSTLYLFAMHDSDGPVSMAKMKCFGVEIYEDNNFVHHFIPVRTDEGELGMYDVIGVEFHGNLGTGAFTTEGA